MGIFRRSTRTAFAVGGAIGGIAATMAASGVPDPAVYLSGAGVASFAAGIAIGTHDARKRQQRTAREEAARSRKPDYNRIAALELDLFGEKFEHDGAPKTPWNEAASRTDSWRETAQPSADMLALQQALDDYQRGVANFRQYPQSRTVASGWQAQVGYYGTVSAYGTWHVPITPILPPPSPQSAEEVAEAFRALAQVCNYPVCPACGSFSTGSTAHPELCASCRRQVDPDGR